MHEYDIGNSEENCGTPRSGLDKDFSLPNEKYDNDIGKSEENGINPRIEQDDDVSVPNGKFLSKELIVLMSIICLSLLDNLSFYLQLWDTQSWERERNWIYYFSMQTIFVPDVKTLWTIAANVVGVIFAALIMEITGRKHIYRYVFALSIFTTILIVAPHGPNFVIVIILFRAIIRGASSVMNAVALAEYSSPKHRFTWLLFYKAVYNTIGRLIFATRIFPTDILWYIILVIQIVLGLICLRFTWVCPESPYWLANKGKLEESREAFLLLRGERGREELDAVLKKRRRPGPPELFWISLLVAVATMSVSSFSHVEIVQSYALANEAPEPIYIHFLSTTAITCTLAAVSYFVGRKLLFIVVSVMSFVFCYIEALFLYISASELGYFFHIASDVLQTSGPAAFGEILSIEITPYKYNTCILCICYIAMCLSTAISLFLTIHFSVLIETFAILLLSTSLALVAALLYFFFAPETKDKTLLEIQRSYAPDEDSNPEQNQSMML